MGIVADSSRLAKMTPVFKSGNPSQTGNYRPISILPIFSKVHLYKYPFGFWKIYDTAIVDTAIVEPTNLLMNNLDRRLKSVVICIYLTKAFYTLNH